MATSSPVVAAAGGAGHWVSRALTSGGPVLVACLVLATVLVAGYGVSLLFRTEDGLDEVLRPYRLHRAARGGGHVAGETSAPVRRAAAILSHLVESRGLLAKFELRLARAGIPIQPGEFLLVCIGLGVVLLMLGGLVAGPAGVLLGALFALVGPLVVLRGLADQRARKFNAQLPDALKLLSSTLRAGFSLSQGFDSLVQQVKDPLQGELRRALAAARLGEALEDALEVVATKMSSRDFEWAVMAIRIQREVGGNLAEILDTVAATMVERERLRRQVHSLTAEGRISALVVGLLPVALGGFIFVVNRPYIHELFTSFAGEAALVAGVVLELVGVWWMYKTIQIEV